MGTSGQSRIAATQHAVAPTRLSLLISTPTTRPLHRQASITARPSITSGACSACRARMHTACARGAGDGDAAHRPWHRRPLYRAADARRPIRCRSGSCWTPSASTMSVSPSATRKSGRSIRCALALPPNARCCEPATGAAWGCCSGMLPRCRIWRPADGGHPAPSRALSRAAGTQPDQLSEKPASGCGGIDLELDDPNPFLH